MPRAGHGSPRWIRSWICVCFALSASFSTTADGDTAATELVPRGAIWRYLDDGSDQGSAWRGTAFDDSAWAEGPAQLGYGDGDETTVVGFGGDPDNKHITTYFRHTFLVTDAASFLRGDLKLVRDDGAVVYLNGAEVFRSNMPEGAIDWQTRAATAATGSQEDIDVRQGLDPGLLVDGVNVLAVEIHQRGPLSSDISFDLTLTASTRLLAVSRGPYLQSGTPTSMMIRWRTDPASDSRVRFGTDPASLDLTVEDSTSTFDHQLTLDGLLPDTRYYYAVGTTSEDLAGGDNSHFFVTSPLLGTPKATRIWVLGDSGTADTFARQVRDGYRSFTGDRHTDLWLMLGDNAYDDGTDEEYQSALFEVYPSFLRTSVLWPTLGNHDGHSADSDSQTGPYYDIFSLPTSGEAGGVPSGTEAYYSFGHGNIHFICLESFETDRSPTGAMISWLESDIAATDADWVIAFWHHPPYSKGSHDSDTELPMTEMRQAALPILEDFGIDLVLSGHSHGYERSFLLDSHYGTSDTLDPSMILDSGDGRPEGDGEYEKPSLGRQPHEGAVYVVAGSSGRMSSGPLNHPAMFFSQVVRGSLVLDISALELEATFIDKTGAVIDTFSLFKSGGNTIFADGFESGDTSAWSSQSRPNPTPERPGSGFQ